MGSGRLGCRPYDGSRASRRWGDLSRKVAGDIYQSIVQGVLSLHQRDIIHCDVSAPNVLLRGSPNSEAFEVKVSDFGCSLNVGESVPTEAPIGALAARSPELLLHQRPVMQSTDVWSLGTLGLMITVGVKDDAD